MYSHSEENYLKALFKYQNEYGSATLTALGRYLGLTIPTINSMVKKLSQKGLVQYRSYQPVMLTDEGFRLARKILWKHRLTETFLVQMLALPPDSVHSIAEQLEHIHSEIFFERIDEILGYPETDPHGEPIPRAQIERDRPVFCALDKLLEGEAAEFVYIASKDKKVLAAVHPYAWLPGQGLQLKRYTSKEAVITYKDEKGLERASALLLGFAAKIIVKKKS